MSTNGDVDMSPTAQRSQSSSTLDPHVIMMLSDSNLPVGGFIASSGLESWETHGFRRLSSHTADSSITDDALHFLRREVLNFATTTIPFVADAWQIQADLIDESRRHDDPSRVIDCTTARLVELDHRHEVHMLSHVTRRASKAQGLAHLSLHLKCFATEGNIGDQVMRSLKREVTLGRALGHLAICWGIMMATLGADLHTTLDLYLYLHCRSVLSAMVRMNIMGPYIQTQILYRHVPGLVQATLNHSGIALAEALPPSSMHMDRYEGGEIETEADSWAWCETGENRNIHRGQTTVWPLGEIIASRHDFQHSRMFNS